MLAVAEPLGGFWANVQDGNVPLFGLPFRNGVISSPHRSEEGVRRPHELKRGRLTDSNFNRKMSVLVINDGRCLAKRNAVKQSVTHGPRLHTLLSEQRWIEPTKLNDGNPVTGLTAFVSVPFLSTAPFFGRVVEPFRQIRGVTKSAFRSVSKPTPANDNWHPVEAA